MARTGGCAAHPCLKLALNPPRWSCERWITGKLSTGSQRPVAVISLMGEDSPWICDSIPEGWHWEEAGDMAVLLGGRKGLALEMERWR